MRKKKQTKTQITKTMGTDRRFRTLIDQMTDALFVIDPQSGTFLEVNEKACSNLGYTSEELLKMGVTDIEVGLPDKFSWQEHVKEVKKRGHMNLEGVHKRKNGTTFPVETSVKFIDHEEGEQLVAVVRDITERKRLDVLKEEFVSIISHELRTPITIIQGAVSHLKEETADQLNKHQKELINMAERNIYRLSKLVNNILNLSRLESDKIKLQRKQVNPALLIQKEMSTFKILADKHKLALRDELPRNLPTVFADEELIIQTMTNLHNNALRFAKKKITIKAKKRKHNNQSVVQIGFIDDGPGIPKEHMGKLFGKFVQFKRPSKGSEYKGTGLGLAICKEIINQHEGQIWVESKKGSGARFYFTIPVYSVEKHFKEALQTAIVNAEENRLNVTVISFNIKNYQRLKRKLGLQEIDSLLNILAKDITDECLRQTDSVFRYGANNFMIILPDTVRQGGASISKRINSLLNNFTSASVPGYEMSMSELGVAVYPEDANQADDLIQKALKFAKT